MEVSEGFALGTQICLYFHRKWKTVDWVGDCLLKTLAADAKKNKEESLTRHCLPRQSETPSQEMFSIWPLTGLWAGLKVHPARPSWGCKPKAPRTPECKMLEDKTVLEYKRLKKWYPSYRKAALLLGYLSCAHAQQGSTERYIRYLRTLEKILERMEKQLQKRNN